MKLVAESVLEVVFLVNRALFVIVDEQYWIERSGASAGDSFLAFFGGGVTGDAGAGAGLVMVGDGRCILVAWSDDLMRCL